MQWPPAPAPAPAWAESGCLRPCALASPCEVRGPPWSSLGGPGPAGASLASPEASTGVPLGCGVTSPSHLAGRAAGEHGSAGALTTGNPSDRRERKQEGKHSARGTLGRAWKGLCGAAGRSKKLGNIITFQSNIRSGKYLPFSFTVEHINNCPKSNEVFEGKDSSRFSLILAFIKLVAFIFIKYQIKNISIIMNYNMIIYMIYLHDKYNNIIIMETVLGRLQYQNRK